MKIIANKNNSMKYLRKYEQHAKKKFGQNFIIDPSVVETIAKYSGTGDLVLAIAPRLGAWTNNVEVILEDFLKTDLSKLENKSMDVCANLPYYITTPILFKLMELDVNKMTLMVQKEIGDRLKAKPNTKDYNALSIQIQHYFEVKQVMKVSRESFHPRPTVESIVIQLLPKHNEIGYDEAHFFDFVKGCFQFRRKTISNNLKAMGYKNITKSLESIGIDPKTRAEALTKDDFLKIYGVFHD